MLTGFKESRRNAKKKEKGEEKIKMKSQKPHKHRLRDSERLY